MEDLEKRFLECLKIGGKIDIAELNEYCNKVSKIYMNSYIQKIISITLIALVLVYSCSSIKKFKFI